MQWLVVPALALGLASQTDPTPPAPSVVQLDVVVQDARGRALDSLTPERFRVGEPGDGLTVVASRFVPSDPAGSTVLAAETTSPRSVAIVDIDGERAAARQPGARVFAFYLDEYHVRPADAARVRDTVSAFVRDRTRPGDLFLVVKPLDSLLDLRLTLDRASVLASVATFEGRRGDYEARNAFEREMVAGDPLRIDGVRAQIAMAAIRAITTHLARLPDVRKALVVVGDRFNRPPARRGDPPVASLDGILRVANRQAVSIYAVIPSSVPAAASDSALDPLRVLASETGGRVVPLSAAADGLPAIAVDMGGYYLLTVSAPADGRFHATSVRVTQPGAQVRSRRGFWSVSSDELTAARLATTPPPARELAPPVRTSRLIRPWFGQSRGEGGRTRVTFTWEPAPPGSAGIPVRGLPPSRLVLGATTEDGTVVYEGVVEPAVGEFGARSRAAFDAPPGRVRLRMSIEDATARVLDTDVRELLVARLDGPLVAGTPSVFRARTARLFNELARRHDAAPTASREFSRVERLLIRVPIYALEPIAASATLVNRAGQMMRVLSVSDDAEYGYSVDLPLASLAAGEYAVAVRAVAGEHEVRETISFRVTP